VEAFKFFLVDYGWDSLFILGKVMIGGNFIYISLL